MCSGCSFELFAIHPSIPALVSSVCLGARWLVVDPPIRHVDGLFGLLASSVSEPGMTVIIIIIILASAALRLGTSSKVSRDEPEATESRAAANSGTAEFCVPQLHLRTWILLVQLPSCIIITRGTPSQASSGGWRSGCSRNPYYGVRRALFRVHPVILCQRGLITHSSVAFPVATATAFRDRSWAVHLCRRWRAPVAHGQCPV